MSMQFFVVQGRDPVYYAVKDDSRAWVYEPALSRLTVYTTVEETPIGTVWSERLTPTSPDDLPRDVRAGFGGMLLGIVNDTTELAALLGVTAPAGVHNSVTGTVTGSVTQYRDVHGDIHFGF